MRATRTDSGAAQAWVGILVLTGIAGALVWLRLGLPLPECAFKRLTGLPCVTCGGTRMLAALLEGDVALALSLNPLAFVGVTLCALWAVASATSLALGRPQPRWPRSPLPASVNAAAVLSAGLASWVYLILRGV